jgi:hypothetical protein
VAAEDRDHWSRLYDGQKKLTPMRHWVKIARVFRSRVAHQSVGKGKGRHMKTFARLLCALGLLAAMASSRVMADPPASPADNIFDFSKPAAPSPPPPPKDSPAPTPDAPVANAPSDTPAPVPAAAKLAVPSPVELTEASKLVDEVFADDISKATTPAQKSALSAKMLQAGIDEKTDMPGKFVLLRRAKDLAVDTGDLASACKAIDAMSETFAIDVPTTKSEAAVAISKSPHLDRAKFIADAQAQADQAKQADEYDLAKQLDQLAVASARQLDDKQLIADATAQLQQTTETLAAYQQVKAAEATLKTKPNDPDANLQVGRFLCFTKGDWDAGLPKLAISNDPTLQTLAAWEGKKPEASEDQAALGDGWWKYAAGVKGSAKNPIQSHAGEWYEKAMPGLNGLSKARVENRLKEIEAALAVQSDWVNLISQIVLTRDIVEGRWSVKDGILSINTTAARQRIIIPCTPEGDYELEAKFVRFRGDEDVNFYLPIGDREAVLLLSGWHGAASGLENIRGRRADQNESSRRPGTLVNGKQYTVQVKVTHDGAAGVIAVQLNGDPFIAWQGSPQDLDVFSDWALPKQHTFGVGFNVGSIIFRSIRVRMVSGKLVRPN